MAARCLRRADRRRRDVSPFRTVDELASHLEVLSGTPSADALGLSELDHAVQCAAVLVTTGPDDLELAVAGLVHDIGHSLPTSTPGTHGALGADAIRPLLGERVARLVAAHVEAKRYLVAVEPGYLHRLTGESVRTLALQGGAMAPAEIAAFAGTPWRAAALRLRTADEAAKDPGRPAPGLATWLPALRRLADSQGA